MRVVSIAVLFILFQTVCAQVEVSNDKSASSIPMFYGFYGYQWPGGDLDEQFGSNSVIGPGFMLKTKSNLVFGAEYNFHFGNNVKNGMEILKNILNSDGNVISSDGTPSLVASFERGNSFGVKFGKLFPVSSKDRNSGVFFTVGTGYMIHKIRIEVENQSAPQLKGDYKRGYDRLSGGIMLNQTIGFMYFGDNKLLNFTLSVDFFEAWVKPYRDYYFDLMAPPPEERQFDFLIGPKIAWMIPLRARNADKYYYY
jgi:hypothetical protein